MKTGLFGQELTIAEQLKAATFVAHARIQTSPFSQALVDCQLPLERNLIFLVIHFCRIIGKFELHCSSFMQH